MKYCKRHCIIYRRTAFVLDHLNFYLSSSVTEKNPYISVDHLVYESVICLNSANYCIISVFENSFKVCDVDVIQKCLNNLN